MVVGFGGYPTVPPLLAASWRGVPDGVARTEWRHGTRQQVAGAARHRDRDRLPHRSKISIRHWQSKITFTGNPVRPQVIAAAGDAVRRIRTDGKFRLLVFGGSQGARVMAEIVPPAIERLNADLRGRLSIVQQARAEDLDAVRAIYARTRR